MSNNSNNNNNNNNNNNHNDDDDDDDDDYNDDDNLIILHLFDFSHYPPRPQSPTVAISLSFRILAFLRYVFLLSFNITSFHKANTVATLGAK